MHQVTFAEAEYRSKRRQTRREKFLAKMDALIPWQRLLDRSEPFYHNNDRGPRA